MVHSCQLQATLGNYYTGNEDKTCKMSTLEQQTARTGHNTAWHGMAWHVMKCKIAGVAHSNSRIITEDTRDDITVIEMCKHYLSVRFCLVSSKLFSSVGLVLSNKKQ